MNPRISNPLASKYRQITRHAADKPLFRGAAEQLRRPSRLTLGAAATVAVAGVAAGVASSLSAGPAPASGAAGNLSDISRATAVHVSGHGADPISAQGSGAPVTLRVPAGNKHGHVATVRRAPRHSSGRATPKAGNASTGNAKAAAHQAPAGKAQGHQAPAHKAARVVVVHKAAAPAKPYTFYDSVTPSAIPAGHEIATYATGGYAVSPSAVAGRHVLWIDTQATDPKAAALDVEPGDATPSQAATWVSQKLTADPHATAIVYTMRSEWGACQSAIAALPSWMHSHVRWWIADPTGYPHVVPGASATQWYWGSSYDISTALPGF